jgi:hypothetical protein
LIPSKLEEVALVYPPVIKNGWAENQNLHFLENPHIFPYISSFTTKTPLKIMKGKTESRKMAKAYSARPPAALARYPQVLPITDVTQA